MANCRPVALTLPALPSTVTVPAAPPKIAKPGCGDIGPFVTAPVASVQTCEVVDHVPLPPPICVALAWPFAFQTFAVMPVVSIRLICFCAVRFCRNSVWPPGAVPRERPPLVSVSVPA